MEKLHAKMHKRENADAITYLSVSVSQLCDCSDGVEACIFSQGVWDDFHGLGEGLEAICVSTNQGVGVLHKLKGQLGF